MISYIIVFLIIIRPVMDMLVKTTIWGGLNFGQLWGISFLIFSFLYLVEKRGSIAYSPQHPLIMALFLCVSYSFFLSSDFFLAGSIFLKFLSWMIASFILFDIFSKKKFFLLFEKKIPYIGWFIVLFYIFIIALSFIWGGDRVSAILGHDIYSYGEETFKGPFPHAHSAAILCFFWLALFIIKSGGKNISQNKNLFIIGGLSTIVFITMTRTGIVATTLFLLIAFKENKKIVFFTSSVLFLVIIFFVSEEVFKDRFLKEWYMINLDQRDYEVIGSGRFGMWAAILKYYFEQNFLFQLFGSGLDADMVATKLYYLPRGAHNDFLYFLIATGFFSVLIFVGYLKKTYRMFFLSTNETVVYYKAFFWSSFALLILQGMVTTMHMFYFVLVTAYSYNKFQYEISAKRASSLRL